MISIHWFGAIAICLFFVMLGVVIGTKTSAHRWVEYEELKATVRSFFEDFIDIREESDSGRVFAPITISSCRCMMTEPLAEVLAKMRKLSGSEK
jgi:hypothetical protein